MHTRRIATFLLGVWIGCSLFMDFLTLQNVRAADWVMANATPSAAKRLKLLSEEDAGLLLRYQGAEMNRRYTAGWETVEIGLALALGLCTFMGTQKRSFPLVLCGVMLITVLFQHIAITPELAYRGRDTDFPPGNTLFGAQSRVWTMQQIFGIVETIKLLLAGVLASYLFVFRSGRRIRKKIDAVDHPNHSHVDG
jgi:hypothetical protein